MRLDKLDTVDQWRLTEEKKKGSGLEAWLVRGPVQRGSEEGNKSKTKSRNYQEEQDQDQISGKVDSYSNCTVSESSHHRFYCNNHPACLNELI